MTRIDQFESVFKAASHDIFELQPIPLRNILLVSDLEGAAADDFVAGVRRYLTSIDSSDVKWTHLAGRESYRVGDLLKSFDEAAPDLICSYRNLHSEAWRWPHSLGDHLDVMTQAAPAPVLVLPRLEETGFWNRQDLQCRRVMALTDHLTGDARLVSYAVRLAEGGGTVSLVHIEDQRIFDHYLDQVIAKIPDIDTEEARRSIAARLLLDPSHYIDSCQRVLAELDVPIQVEKVVKFGHRLSEVRTLVEGQQSDLLVLNTRDDDQMAMHGLAYPLAVEFRHTPLLML